jgi:hypothetical protein
LVAAVVVTAGDIPLAEVAVAGQGRSS